MKAKVIIENGVTELILSAENDFETDIIEKFDNSKSTLTSRSNIEKQYSVIRSAKIHITLTDNA